MAQHLRWLPRPPAACGLLIARDKLPKAKVRTAGPQNHWTAGAGFAHNFPNEARSAKVRFADARLEDIPGDVVIAGQVQQDWGPHLIDIVKSEAKAYLIK